MFPDTITLYNKYKQDGVEKWKRTVISGVQWNEIKGSVTRKTGVQSADSIMIIIPCFAAAQETYLKPKEFDGQPNKGRFWTLRGGDSVILGAVDQEIVKTSAELRNFDDVCLITSADYKHYGGNMAHWEVSGK